MKLFINGHWLSDSLIQLFSNTLLFPLPEPRSKEIFINAGTNFPTLTSSLGTRFQRKNRISIDRNSSEHLFLNNYHENRIIYTDSWNSLRVAEWLAPIFTNQTLFQAENILVFILVALLVFRVMYRVVSPVYPQSKRSGSLFLGRKMHFYYLAVLYPQDFVYHCKCFLYLIEEG